MTFSMIVLFFVLMVVAVAIAAVVFIFLQKRTTEEQVGAQGKDYARRQARAVWASATPLSARGGVITGSEGGVSAWARYELDLEVAAPGGAAYAARTNWMVEVAQLSMLAQGQQVSVRIDQQDPAIIYPNVTWAKYIPAG